MILSMFREKDGATSDWSMTRTVAFLFAVTYCFALVRYSEKAQQIGWPFAALGIITLMAVPLQAMWRMLRVYFTSRPGEALLGQVIEHFAPMVATGVVKTTEHIEHTEERHG